MSKAKHLATPSGYNSQTSLLGFFAGIENYATQKGPTSSITNTYKAAQIAALVFLTEAL